MGGWAGAEVLVKSRNRQKLGQTDAKMGTFSGTEEGKKGKKLQEERNQSKGPLISGNDHKLSKKKKRLVCGRSKRSEARCSSYRSGKKRMEFAGIKLGVNNTNA